MKKIKKIKKPSQKVRLKRKLTKRSDIQTNEGVSIPEIKIKQEVQILRGVRDILPDELVYWDYLLKKLVSLAEAYSFKEIIVPVLERQLLFEKSTGITTDLVEKQMYQFRDKSGNQVVLRPEFTPGVARAYLEHGMFNLPQPVKLYYFGPLFRFERPQAGRGRQFHQFGLEVLGSAEPVVDAQLILFSQSLFNNLDIKANIQVNSLGCPTCRKSYRSKLINYFKFKKKWLCPDCQRRLNKNPLRILDCQNSGCRNLVRQAPQSVDGLCGDCQNHFIKTLEYLDEANVIYSLNPYLVRGLDYYTRTVFEFYPDRSALQNKIQEKGEAEVNSTKSGKGLRLLPKGEKKQFNKADFEINMLGSQSALGGGGRYDNLIESLGGRPTPASGLSYGLERIIEEVKIQGVKVSKSRGPQIFLAQIGERSSRRALKLFNELQKQGFRIAEDLTKNSLKTQMERANKLGVKLTLILGQQEVIDNTVIIRNMNTGNQEVVDQEKIVKELKKRLR